LFDVNGTLVKTVVNGHRERGIHFYGWDGTDGRGKQVRPGVYFCYLNGIMQNKVFYTGR
jgi:flagellar hook assembly protein FlgD